jgi:hypothetical protein
LIGEFEVLSTIVGRNISAQTSQGDCVRLAWLGSRRATDP